MARTRDGALRLESAKTASTPLFTPQSAPNGCPRRPAPRAEPHRTRSNPIESENHPGCGRKSVTHAKCGLGSPAGAGIDPPPAACRHAAPRIDPCRRGDRPPQALDRSRPNRFGRVRRWFPRRRGDRPRTIQVAGLTYQLSAVPRRRGDRPREALDPHDHRTLARPGSPAGAGIDPLGDHVVARRLPRRRGDRPFCPCSHSGRLSRFPRRRGDRP